MKTTLEELSVDGKVFRLGMSASYHTGWGGASYRYAGRTGKIVFLTPSCVSIEYPDGQRIGPKPSNAYLVHENNIGAKMLLDKEW